MKKPSEIRDFLVSAMDRFFEGEGGFALAAGEPKKIEVGRSGTFVGMGGVRVKFTPDSLEQLAARFALDRDHKIKIGHGKIETHTPDYGDVTALAYDKAADRLMATIDPSEALVDKNHKERFRRVSMELSVNKDEGYDFDTASFLGACPPAISGLKPVDLAAAESTETHQVFIAADPDDDDEDDEGPQERAEFALTVAPKEEASENADETKKEMAAEGGLTNLLSSTPEIETQEIKAMDDKQIAKLARLEKQAKDGATNLASAFIAANTKKIPMKVRKAGFEPGLIALLANDSTADEVTQIKFASIDEKGVSTEIEETASGFVMRMFAAMPDQTTPAEEKDTAKNGAEDAEESVDFAGADKESVDFHFAVEREVASAKEKGETINYLQGVQRVERARSRK